MPQTKRKREAHVALPVEAAVAGAQPSFSVVDAYLWVLQGQRAQDSYLALSEERQTDVPLYASFVNQIPSLKRYADEARSYAESHPDSENADMALFRASSDLSFAERCVEAIKKRMQASKPAIQDAEACYSAVLGEVLEDILRCFPTGELPALIVGYTLEPFTPFAA